MTPIEQGLAAYFHQRFASRVLGGGPPGTEAGGRSPAKAEGYGEPLAVELERADGSRWRCVFHTARANEFGHDRRSDRALEQLLAFDTCRRVPRHVAALDVGALGPTG